VTPARSLYVQHPYFVLGYPFLGDRLRRRLRELGDVDEAELPRGVPLSARLDLAPYHFVFYAGGKLTAPCVGAATSLRAVATYTDNTGGDLPWEALEARGVPVIDYTRGAAPSVAETALALTLCALRRIPMWHDTLAGREPMRDFPVGQFCDDPNYVNGTLATKRVGVIGLGQIGRRVAEYCLAFEASVMGYDPFLPRELAESWGVEPVDVDRLVDAAEIVVVCVPPTPSARHLLDRARIARLRPGAIVVVVTRAHAVDMDALRERIVAGELVGAFDVYDEEPLPIDDPLRGRPNVVHLPHIAGRTVDHSTRSADLIADDFARIWRGEPPRSALSPSAAAVRASVSERPY
jgi:phosphoglycerate dehydrogenase-like enzyme